MNYLITATIVLSASLIKGSTGFGFSMAALPLMALQYPLKTAVPIITFWSLATSVIIILQKKSYTISKEDNSVVFWGALGTVIGTLFITHIKERLLVLMTAILFAVLTLLALKGIELKVRNRKRATIRTGLISGILAGSISISGPPVTLFLNAIQKTKEEFREIFARFDLFTSTVALAGFTLTGYFRTETLFQAAFFIPVIFAGSFIGKRLNRRMSPLLFRKVNLVLSLASCIILLIKFL